jgi:hypothetical protein
MTEDTKNPAPQTTAMGVAPGDNAHVNNGESGEE